MISNMLAFPFAPRNRGQILGAMPDPSAPTMGNHMVPPTTQLQAEGLAQPQPIPGGSGQALQPFMANGPFALQALRLAGLLSGQGGAPPPGAMPPGIPPRPVMGSPYPSRPYTPGRFMPGFRPGVDTPIIGGGGAGRGRSNVQQY